MNGFTFREIPGKSIACEWRVYFDTPEGEQHADGVSRRGALRNAGRIIVKQYLQLFDAWLDALRLTTN